MTRDDVDCKCRFGLTFFHVIAPCVSEKMNNSTSLALHFPIGRRCRRLRFGKDPTLGAFETISTPRWCGW